MNPKQSVLNKLWQANRNISHFAEVGKMVIKKAPVAQLHE